MGWKLSLYSPSVHYLKVYITSDASRGPLLSNRWENSFKSLAQCQLVGRGQSLNSG